MAIMIQLPGDNSGLWLTDGCALSHTGRRIGSWPKVSPTGGLRFAQPDRAESGGDQYVDCAIAGYSPSLLSTLARLLWICQSVVVEIAMGAISLAERRE
ncbi:hypothetical protein BOX37_00415 [Nocardia mangyaensis]|uniref:Uncharacterized protein n=1 Tax=Nocardia mangyaensis TaxID=2213200 RepID=A0A1J0VL10_9NOCA|nr:hypothetical protein BOX37_00415 [Nocardia mangyaensis]